jgi:hypothetical protein
MTKIFKGYHTSQGGFIGTFQEGDQPPVPVNLTRSTWIAIRHFMVMLNQPFEIDAIIEMTDSGIPHL